jgi:transcription antitermination factor NusG
VPPGLSLVCAAADGTAGLPAWAEPAPWYAVYARSSQEFIASEHLTGLGFHVFLPCYTRTSRWTDRRKTIVTPLFTGYLFAQIDSPKALNRARHARGVAQIITPAIDASVIADLVRIVDNPARVRPADYRPGERVTIAHGPLTGISGVVERTASVARLIVTVEALGRACAVEVAARDLERDFRGGSNKAHDFRGGSNQARDFRGGLNQRRVKGAAA